MKSYALGACLLFAFGVPGCQTAEFALKRIASTETRYPDDNSCDEAAKTFLPNAIPISPTQSPRVYSLVKGSGDAKEEVLYKTSPQLPKTITYYEVEAPQGMSDNEYRQLLQVAFKALLKLSTDIESIQSPVRDKYEANKKFPWRAILTAKKPVDLNVGGDKDKKSAIRVNGDFGIIINPPYPP
jgi:hypothetical protein